MAALTTKSDEEKIASASYRENNKSAATSSTDIRQSQPFDQAATKRLLRKLDNHLIPFLSLIYL
jgi:hypothetical protein